MQFSTPLRYPGGKGKLTDFIKLVFEQNELLDGHYVEPYAGGAGIALTLLLHSYASCIHLNDINPAVYAFWHSVLNETDTLCSLISKTEVNMDVWNRQKYILNFSHNFSLLELGFATFFLNRTNRSGIIKGGVIGGKNQDGPWKLDARFNREDLILRIQRIAMYSSRIRLYNVDAAQLICKVIPKLPAKTLVYLDPPYYVKGKGLYENHYNHCDHEKISKLVANRLKRPWIVSYDHAPQIVSMYPDFSSIVYGLNYSAQNRYEGAEVMFFSEKLVIPDVRNPSKLKTA